MAIVIVEILYDFSTRSSVLVECRVGRLDGSLMRRTSNVMKSNPKFFELNVVSGACAVIGLTGDS